MPTGLIFTTTAMQEWDRQYRDSHNEKIFVERDHTTHSNYESDPSATTDQGISRKVQNHSDS